MTTVRQRAPVATLLLLIAAAALLQGAHALRPMSRHLAGVCDKCNIPLSQGGCKCDSKCACLPGQSANVCDKCNLPASQGGCKCDSKCACLGATNVCDKCNLPPSQGGCKCDNQCNCLSDSNNPGSGNVLTSKSNSAATYYFDIRGQTCNGDAPYAENNGYPLCASYTPGANQQTLAQLGSNNVVAIDANELAANRGKLCGKKVIVWKNGVQVAAPDGGNFFVWDGCAACVGGGRIDFSVSGARKVDNNACAMGVVPGVSYQVVDQVVKPFVP